MAVCFAATPLALAIYVAVLPTVSAQGGYDYWLANINSFEVRVGTTASFQGQYSEESMDAYQGLRLTEEVINSQGMFKRRGDGNITVKLTVFDDESSPSKTAERFQEMVDSKDFDFFIGPYSSRLSQEAIGVTENAYPKQILMLHAAPDPGVFGNTKRVFATNTLASDYFANGLEQLRNSGAQTVTLVRSPGPLNRAMCDGAKQHAIRLNYKILQELVMFSTDAIEAVRASRDAHADVFIACSSAVEVVTSIAMTSKALMFSPRAMLMNRALSQGFIDAVGAKNANYILGPVSWDREVDLACKVFGNSENFYELYKQRWGMDPTEHSASAASALITLLLVTERYANSEKATETRPPVPNEVIWNLRNKEFKTFAANLRFHRNGTRHWGAFSFTKQILPDSSATSAIERYTQSAAVLLTEERQPLYPAPTWEQRELQVYPCPRGTELSVEMQCELCPVGKARDKYGLVCRSCTGNSYGDKLGLSRCIHCKRGMKCEGSTEFAAAPGFYRLRTIESNQPSPATSRQSGRREDEQYAYHECDPPELCIGSNRCSGHNIGTMCAQCPSGYTNRRSNVWGDTRNACDRCDGVLAGFLWFIGAIFIYFVQITLVSLSDRASSKNLSSVHGVIIKIIINYLQFMSTVFAAADFQGVNSNPVLKTFIQVACNPLKQFLILDCFSDKLHTSHENMTILLGWTLIPIGLSFSWLFFALLTFLHLCCTGRQRRKRIVHEEKSEGAASYVSEAQTTSVDDEDEDDNEDVFGGLSAAIEEAEEIAVEDGGSPPPKTAAHIMQSNLDSTATGPSKVLPDNLKEERKEDKQESARSTQNQPVSGTFWELATRAVRPPEQYGRMEDHLNSVWIRTAVISIFILYPVALEMLISGLYCRRIDKLRLVSNLDVICHEGEHIGWFYASLGGMLLYGLGIPLLIIRKLFAIRNVLLDLNVRRTYGFLYNGFEPQYYHFEVFYMIRKFLLILASAIPDIYARIMIMLWMSLAFMAVQLVCRPWDNRAFFIFDKLETLNLLIVFLSLALRLIFEIRRDVVSPIYKDVMEHRSFNVIGWLFLYAAHAAFWLTAILSLVRNFVIRHLQFRERVFPHSLSPFQSFLCRLSKSKNNIITMHPLSHTLDFEDVSTVEKDFIATALYDTLEQYIVASKKRDKFCLEYMWSALQDTFVHYEHIHKRKIEKLIRRQKMRFGSDVEFNPIMLTAKDGLTVEEFQAALMASWPGIAKGDDKYFVPFTQYDHSERLTSEAQAHDLVWGKDLSLTHMLDILRRREELLADEEDHLARTASQTIRMRSRLTRTEDMGDDERVLRMVGMEDARSEVMASTLSSKQKFGDFETLLQDYEAKFEEMLTLTGEAVYLRDRCTHRVYQPKQGNMSRQLSQASDMPRDPIFSDDCVLMPRESVILEFEKVGQGAGTGASPSQSDAAVTRQEDKEDAGFLGLQTSDSPGTAGGLEGNADAKKSLSGLADGQELPAEARPKAAGKAKPKHSSTTNSALHRDAGQPSHPLQKAFQEKAHPLSAAFLGSTAGPTTISVDAGITPTTISGDTGTTDI